MKLYCYFCLFILVSLSSSLDAKCECNAPVNHARLLDEWNHKTKISNRKEVHFLITGCARSGTSYIAKFFWLHGLHVKHECDANYGIVSWPMAVNSNKSVWGPAPNRFFFKHIFHQVRHPLKTIASVMATEGSKSWNYICSEVPEIKIKDSTLVRAAKYWYYWNLQAESKAEFTYQVENVAAAIPEMSRILGIHLDPTKLDRISKTLNHRGEPQKVTWLDLRRVLNDKMYDRIICLAERYGYDVKEAKRYSRNYGAFK